MGRVTANPSPTAAAPAAAPPASTTLKHFTHPHELHPTTIYHPQTLCTGCKLQASGTMYTCQPCSFTLHHTCAKLPQLITHPSHGGCTLTLLAAASYPGGAFSCDGCGRGGDGWSYHCIRCEYDLHVSCAVKPLKIRHHSHATCDLQLTFKNPYAHASGFSCDICRKIGSKQWLYRCNSCEYDVHLGCAAAPRPTLQQHHSLPASSSLHHHHDQFMHSASSGGMNPAAQVNGFMGPPPQQHPHLVHSVSAGNYPYGGVNQGQFVPGQVIPGQVAPGQIYGSGPGINQQPMMNNGSSVGPTKQNNNNNNNQGPKNSGFGNNMMMSAMQGLVEGAAQAVAQTVVQEMIGGGGDGGGSGFADGGGGGGGDAGGEDLYPC
ncbi:hypothetical protein ABFS82_09G072500 [Erythranthe guttata]|uniref:uncharacterized protein LOC105975537 n=1 Tax=Erythranthe guttata TaxID=4155 RepID=UPI00064DAD06|nr:PREDICTED: uncharacterized protein LOC105975537 [Erythranthe guttata]|eukprot:XP_012856186.1 PREDICTED: uncharacterized protein LOC105975537 [Erythranthe guttata]